MTDIFIATHKEFTFPKETGYIPIHVGADGKENNICEINDNTGVNLSNKNSSYCELTALYWIWKNSNSENIGLCHYRRYFSYSSNKFNIDYLTYKIISPDYIDRKLEENNLTVFLPEKIKLKKKKIFSVTVKEHYINNHNEEDWLIMKNVVSELYPEYEKSFSIIENSKSLSCFNMIISNRNIISQYCKWLFDILFEVEKRVGLGDRNQYQSRIFGFMSERLLNVYFEHNKEMFNIEYLKTIMVK